MGQGRNEALSPLSESSCGRPLPGLPSLAVGGVGGVRRVGPQTVNPEGGVELFAGDDPADPLLEQGAQFLKGILGRHGEPIYRRGEVAAGYRGDLPGEAQAYENLGQEREASGASFGAAGRGCPSASLRAAGFGAIQGRGALRAVGLAALGTRPLSATRGRGVVLGYRGSFGCRGLDERPPRR